MIIRKIRLTEYEYQPPINFVAGATEPDIQFQLADYDIPAGATARCYVQRFDGTFEYTVATIDGNNVTVEPTSSMFSVRGEGAIQITLYAGEEVLKNFSVPVFVHTDLADENAEQGSDVTGIFRAAEEQALEDFAEDAEAKAEEVIESIPEDYTTLTEEVSELNERLEAVPNIATPEETEADLYICDAQGNVIGKFQDGHFITKYFDSATIGDLDDLTTEEKSTLVNAINEAAETGGSATNIIMDTDASDADLYICDSFGNVVAKFKNGHIVTKNFDSSAFEDVPEDVDGLKTDVASLQAETSGIFYRTKDQTDGVYASCRWHQPNSSSKQFCLLIAGDIHTDPTRMVSIIDYLNTIDAFDAGIMLGDISGNTFDDPITYYTNAISNVTKPFITVIGNHDVGGATSDSDLWGKYGSCFDYADLASGEAVSGKCYYYKDFSAQKIRIIVLMQYDYTYNGNLCFGQTQIDWLISTLSSTPSDYGVIIAEHTNPSRYMTYEMDTAYTSDTWRRSNYAPTVMDGDPVPDIVNAWINGTTLSQTYGYTFENPPADLSVSADFTARGAGEFITYLGGHWHMDVLGHPTSYDDQMDYHIPAAGLSAATQGDIPRRAGTASEDSFGVIGIDREKKTVKVFHVGAHRTKDAIDRQYFQYGYGGEQ